MEANMKNKIDEATTYNLQSGDRRADELLNHSWMDVIQQKARTINRIHTISW